MEVAFTNGTTLILHKLPTSGIEGMAEDLLIDLIGCKMTGCDY
jgi:hypothetical protein